ncbi:hypothetical protein A0256_03185 [Mucilaginibacter sp. PAMC 26640]|nr:hypothetical protein A0256_03185 [Mucilaginibacter sp. PAMC 26640]
MNQFLENLKVAIARRMLTNEEISIISLSEKIQSNDEISKIINVRLAMLDANSGPYPSNKKI